MTDIKPQGKNCGGRSLEVAVAQSHAQERAQQRRPAAKYLPRVLKAMERLTCPQRRTVNPFRDKNYHLHPIDLLLLCPSLSGRAMVKVPRTSTKYFEAKSCPG
jgi:hypothetical protein